MRFPYRQGVAHAARPHGTSSALANTRDAVVLSANPWTFQFGSACASNCGKVLVLGDNLTEPLADLYTPEDHVTLALDEAVSTDGTRAQVTGSITCEAGDAFLLEQDRCGCHREPARHLHGQAQTFRIAFNTSGPVFSDGAAQACASLSTAVPGSRDIAQSVALCQPVTIDVPG